GAERLWPMVRKCSRYASSVPSDSRRSREGASLTDPAITKTSWGSALFRRPPPAARARQACARIKKSRLLRVVRREFHLSFGLRLTSGRCRALAREGYCYHVRTGNFASRSSILLLARFA